MRHYVFTGRPLGLVSSREPSHAPRTPQKECVFCRIASSGGEKNKLVFSTAKLVVFADHRPAAARHFLVGPREHIDGLYDLEGEEDLELLDEMIRVGEKVVLLEAAAEEARATTTTTATSTSDASAASASASASSSSPPRLSPRVKLGVHIPPWNSVDHLHLHAFLLPHTGGIGQRIRFAETPGAKARLWYASAEQVRRRLVARNDDARRRRKEKEAGAAAGAK